MNAGILPAVTFDHLSRLICFMTIAAAAMIMTSCYATVETENARDSVTGWTALHYVAAADLPEAVERLVGFGTSVDVRMASGPDFGERLLGVLIGIGHGELFEGWRASGETPLMIAAYTGSLSAVVALETHGADVNAKNDYGRTPLHFAAWGGHADAMEFLAERGADVSATDIRGWTLPHHAANEGHMDAMKWLVERGADVNAKGGYETPLHLAARGGHVDAMELLLERGADVNATTGSGKTSLHHAAERGHMDAMEWLLERGAE